MLGKIVLTNISSRKKKKDAKDFFLAQGKLSWYVIGFAMIAAGISSEQFLGTVGFAFWLHRGAGVIDEKIQTFLSYSLSFVFNIFALLTFFPFNGHYPANRV